MKNKFFVAICILCSIAFVVKQDNSKTFKKLYALEGTWIMKTSRGVIGETWVKVDEHYLQNKGFMLKGKDTIITEQVALRYEKNAITYTSTVENQNNKQPITFKLTSSEKDIFIFENPEHDFPKRIVYELISAGSVHAYIDGGKSAPAKKQDFYYRKAK